MASLEVQHFVCLGLFKLTLLTLTDTSSRRMNCHITLANVLRRNGGERNWNVQSPQVQNHPMALLRAIRIM